MTSRKKSTKTLPSRVQKSSQTDTLDGWQKIAAFLGQPVSVAQRWAKDGMPIAHRGRLVIATPAELNSWLGRESNGELFHVADRAADLTAELERGLSFVRREKKP